MRFEIRDTRLAIVDAAIDLFARLGLYKVSFSMIAKVVRVSQPAIYKHFENKEDLLCACALRAAEKGRLFIDANVRPEASAQERLRQYVHANLLWVKERQPEARTLLAMYYYAPSLTKVGAVNQQVGEVGIQRIHGLLTQGKHEGWISGASDRGTAALIHSLLAGEMFKQMHFPDALEVEARSRLIWKAVRKVLS